MRKPPLSRHPAFSPLIAVWLAALLGGSIAVLPTGLVSAGLAQAPFAIPAFAASQIALAGLAAFLGAGLGWAAARTIFVLQRRASQPAEVTECIAADSDQVEPVEIEAVEPMRVAELEEFAGSVDESEIIDPDAYQEPAPETVHILDDATPEQPPYDDAPHYADIDLSQLLGAPKVEAADPVEVPIEVEATVQPNTAMAPQPMPAPIPEVVQTGRPEAMHDAEPPPTAPEPQVKLPQHGKAVNLLRTHDTRELAMPQLIERFAVALDDQRRLAASIAHSYSPPIPPTDMTQRLRALVEAPQPAE